MKIAKHKLEESFITAINHIAKYGIYVIRTNNGDIVRTEKQFADDLKLSAIPMPQIAIMNARGSSVVCNIARWNAGDQFVASEYNSVVAKGEAKVGDLITAEKQGHNVDGFLQISLPQATIIAITTSMYTQAAQATAMVNAMSSNVGSGNGAPEVSEELLETLADNGHLVEEKTTVDTETGEEVVIPAVTESAKATAKK